MKHLAFIDETVNMGLAFQGSYDPFLVLVSYAVAVLAAHAALKLSSVITDSVQSRTRYTWIAAGAVAMGVGIWAMHFIGMLAYILPTPVVYDPTLTLVSMLPAMLASAVVLDVISRSSLGTIRLITGGILMGSGIGLMHYTGMAAMHMDASMLYDPTLFVTSIVVAVVLAMLALYIKFLPEKTNSQPGWIKLASPMAMGLAVAGMHYTAMFSVYFFPNSGDVIIAGLDPSWLAGLIGVASFFILSLVLLAAFAGNQLTAKNQLAIEVSKRREAEETLIKIADGLELRVAEQTIDIQKNEAQLKAVFETLVEGLITISSKGIVEEFNPSAERLFGYNKSEVIGMNIKMLMPRPYCDEHDGYLANYMRTGEAKIIGSVREVTGRRKDGSLFPMSLSVAEMKVGEQRLFTGVVRDITLQKQAQNELWAEKEKSDAATKAKSEFLANMSHEIRTPMNGVLGMLELLQYTDLNERQQRFVETARSSAKSLLTVINDILDFSKIEAGHLKMEKIVFDLRKIVEDSVILLAKEAATSGLELNCFLPADVPRTVSGDPVRLRQILTNLISNSIKFTHEGEINIKVEQIAIDDARVCLRFEVSDTGIGIAKDKLNNLFDAFVQEDGSTTRKYGGTGLGLSISKQLVELMGGEIGVISNKGEGSTFFFTVYFDHLALDDDLVMKSLPGDLRVLVVDDNKTNREIVSYYLTQWNIHSEIAEDGKAALSILRQASSARQPYHIVLLDYHMPEIDGLELARLIKADNNISGTHLIMLSSVNDSEDEILQAGVERHLVKPARQSDIYDALMQVAGTMNVAAPAEENKYGMRKEDLQLGNVTILLVDDLKINLMVAQEMLLELSVKSDLANNGSEALSAVAKKQYDLVLMDCQMPVMDGFAATEAIRAMEKINGFKRMPIVALTAHAMEGDREACLKSGMDDYLAKPFSRDELATMITRWLPADNR